MDWRTLIPLDMLHTRMTAVSITVLSLLRRLINHVLCLSRLQSEIQAQKGKNGGSPYEELCFVSPCTCVVEWQSTRLETGIGLAVVGWGNDAEVQSSVSAQRNRPTSVGVTAVRGTVERVASLSPKGLYCEQCCSLKSALVVCLSCRYPGRCGLMACGIFSGLSDYSSQQ